jgi:hypothetical protein
MLWLAIPSAKLIVAFLVLALAICHDVRLSVLALAIDEF